MRFGTNYGDTLNLLYLEFHAFKSNVESPGEVKSSKFTGVVVLTLKLFRGFCSDDFAEAWRVMISCYYKLIVEV